MFFANAYHVKAAIQTGTVILKDLRSEPVGYMGVKQMFPLNFEEFITAVGVQPQVIEALQKAWEGRAPVDDVLHAKMLELFRLYLVVGGMPAAVTQYLKSNNLQEVMLIQRDIIHLYKRDIAQYDPGEKLHTTFAVSPFPQPLQAVSERCGTTCRPICQRHPTSYYLGR
jgi:predicted AAA+ superfamily ATPase